ncbi:lambda-crystallin homolog isoform X3 [Triplophysa dalaica]|nr:lambda-crystallin homolog isoform X3 [Triplophysa dalaica]
MLRGNLSAAEQLSLLSSHDDLQQALEGAYFVQECVFEDLEAKQTVFQEVENLVTENVILSSSTSCLMPSNVFCRVKNQTRCIISHPVNPPYYVRLVELVPHPKTHETVMDVAYSLMTDVGQAPVRLRKEIDGFALNRVQYAIIAESWRLVQFEGYPTIDFQLGVHLGPLRESQFWKVEQLGKDGVISVKDIDLVMSEGLGMRYAFLGPIETMHLNAPEGIEDYLQRYSEGIKRVLTTFGPVPEFSGEAAARITKEISELIPGDQEHLTGRRERRDQMLMGLAKLKK